MNILEKPYKGKKKLLRTEWWDGKVFRQVLKGGGGGFAEKEVGGGVEEGVMGIGGQ